MVIEFIKTMILEQKVLQKIAEDVLKQEHKLENKLFDLAKELESIALNDDYFVEKKLYPNVDFLLRNNIKSNGFSYITFYSYFCCNQNCRVDFTLE